MFMLELCGPLWIGIPYYCYMECKEKAYIVKTLSYVDGAHLYYGY